MSTDTDTDSIGLKNTDLEQKILLNTSLDLEENVYDSCEGENLDLGHEDGKDDENTDQNSSAKTFTITRNNEAEKRDEGTDSNDNLFGFDFQIIIGSEKDFMNGSSGSKEIEGIRMIKKPDSDFSSVSNAITFTDSGEPMRTQHLMMDFNPATEDDNEYNSQKCVDFFKFIEKHEELHHLKVLPEMEDYGESESSPTTEFSSGVSTEVSEKTDLSPITQMALNWLKNDKIMSDSLKTKVVVNPQTNCEPVSKQYIDYGGKTKWSSSFADKRYSRQAKKKWIPGLGKISSSSKSLAKYDGAKLAASKQDDLTQLMTEMHKWDLEHPKATKRTEPPITTVDSKTVHKSLLPIIGKSEELYCEKCLQ